MNTIIIVLIIIALLIFAFALNLIIKGFTIINDNIIITNNNLQNLSKQINHLIKNK